MTATAMGRYEYHVHSAYAMQWNKDLQNQRVSLAGDGSLVAVTKNPQLSSLDTYRASPSVYIYNGAGHLLQTIRWEGADIVGLGWAVNETLVIVARTGVYRLYSWNAAGQLHPTQFSTFGAAPHVHVHEAYISSTGMVLLMADKSLVCVSGWDRATTQNMVKKLKAPYNELSEAISLMNQPAFPHENKISVENLSTVPEDISAWCASLPMPGARTTSVDVLAVAGSSLFHVTKSSVNLAATLDGETRRIAPSPDRKNYALLTDKSLIVYTAGRFEKVFAVDLNDVLSSYDTTQCVDVDWCGDDLVLFHAASVVLVSMSGEHRLVENVTYEPIVAHLAESDLVRVITNSHHIIVMRTGMRLSETLGPRAKSPAARLVRAQKYFADRDATADTIIREIRADLVDAVDTCIECSAYSWDVPTQKRLLLASQFGKAYITSGYSAQAYIHTARSLRVLNAVRSPSLGMPISYTRFRDNTPAALVACLIRRAQYAVALHVCDLLNLDDASVRLHWAKARILDVTIDAVEQEEALADWMCSTIVEQEAPAAAHVTPIHLAMLSYHLGHAALAKRLVDREPLLENQAMLLSEIREFSLALQKAMESGVPHVIHSVLWHYRRQHKIGQFFRFINAHAASHYVLESFARFSDKELLRDWYYHEDERRRAAYISIDEAYAQDDLVQRAQYIGEAARLFSEDKASAFEAKQSSDHVRLVRLQKIFEGDMHMSFMGLSVTGTIRQCILGKNPKAADTVKSQFRVSDRRFWIVKLNALADMGDFEALSAIAQGGRKNIIPYADWVTMLASKGHTAQAAQYVPLCKPSERVDLYVKLDDWLRAGQEAVQQREPAVLEGLIQACPHATVLRQLVHLKNRLE